MRAGGASWPIPTLWGARIAQFCRSVFTDLMPPYNAQSWKMLIKSLTPEVEFGQPATEAQIATVEQTLRIRFPDGLRDLLREADGVTDSYGHGPIWSLAEIEKQNQEFRTTAA